MSKLRQTFFVRGFLAVGGVVVAAAALNQAIVGSAFLNNVVGVTRVNPNPSFIVDTRAAFTPIQATVTKTGATITSPFSSTASARGLRHGSGYVLNLFFDVVANPNNYAGPDCTKVPASSSSTGGTVLFSNSVTTATGSMNSYSTIFTMGPLDKILCKSAATATGYSAFIKGTMVDSDVTK